jgi:hypothetical protein
VNTSGNVIYLPPSSGQHFRIGSESSVPLRSTIFGTPRPDRLARAAQADHRQYLERVHDARNICGVISSSISAIVERIHAEGEAHPLVGAVDVRRDRDVVAVGFSNSSAGRRRGLRLVGDGGDLEVGLTESPIRENGVCRDRRGSRSDLNT